MNQKNKVFLSLIFSFYNEAAVLPSFIERIRKVMTDELKENHIRQYELIFVNDASDDNSEIILRNLSQEHKDMGIITMSRRFGVASCVIAGLSYARGDCSIYMDCDLQDPPEVIPQMIQAYRDSDADVVHTKRIHRQGESPFKLFLTKIGYKVLNRYSNVPMPQEAGDFKLLSRRVVDHILQLKEYNPYIRGLVSYVGFKQIFITYKRHPRHAGESKFFILGPKAVSNFLNSLVGFSSVPLQISSYCGICSILIDFVLMLYALYQKLSGQSVGGWTAIMIVILFIGGVQLFCIGMIGLYLNSVHEQTKMRPNYIINSTYGFEDLTK